MDKAKREKLELREYKRQLREKAADEREAKTGMRQSNVVMAVKIIVGVACLSGGFLPNDEGQFSVLSMVKGVLIGTGFIAWGLIPYMNAKKKKEQQDLKEILATPLQTYEDLELQRAKERVNRQEPQKKPAEKVGESKDEMSEIEKLKKYKEMLDQGLITKKDYDQKKKDILGL